MTDARRRGANVNPETKMTSRVRFSTLARWLITRHINPPLTSNCRAQRRKDSHMDRQIGLLQGRSRIHRVEGR